MTSIYQQLLTNIFKLKHILTTQMTVVNLVSGFRFSERHVSNTVIKRVNNTKIKIADYYGEQKATIKTAKMKKNEEV